MRLSSERFGITRKSAGHSEYWLLHSRRLGYQDLLPWLMQNFARLPRLMLISLL